MGRKEQKLEPRLARCECGYSSTLSSLRVRVWEAVCAAAHRAAEAGEDENANQWKWSMAHDATSHATPAMRHWLAQQRAHASQVHDFHHRPSCFKRKYAKACRYDIPHAVVSRTAVQLGTPCLQCRRTPSRTLLTHMHIRPGCCVDRSAGRRRPLSRAGYRTPPPAAVFVCN
jgi:hypothetical protein